MKTLLSFTAFCFTIVCLSFNGATAQKDAKAQEVLKGVSTKYRSYKSIEASFKLNRVDQKSKKTDSFIGTITISGERYNFVMNNQTVMCDGKTTWTYLKESNEVQVSEAKNEEGSITPTSIFTMYENGFKSKFLGDIIAGGKKVQLIELTPEDSKKNYFKIMLQVDKTGKYISEAKIYEKNGSILTYSIVKFTPNPAVSDDKFVFNKAKYPGVDVVDLR